jgi:aminopeptidase YwaD
MGLTSLKRLWFNVAIAGVLLAACGGSSSPPGPTSTPTLAPLPTAIDEPTSVPSLAPTTQPSIGSSAGEPDGDRILEDVITLSAGPRSSATERERIAAEEIADRLRDLGYEVTVQEFSVGSEQGRASVLNLISPAERTVPTLPLANSPTATVRGNIVYISGVGAPEDFPSEAAGAIALIERGTLFFQDKVANAAAAGALGVIIYNNEAGTFLGSADVVPIPAVTISQREGQDLVAALQGGEVVAEVGVGALSDAVSRNVIAKPPGAECETISGGHYDSVPQAPGASDNASGTATVLEIAAVLMSNGGAGDNCFVLFGAEELGLLGSKYFVSTLTEEEKGHIKAMLNFDMVGVGDDTWWLIGTPELQQQMDGLADGLSIDAMASNLAGTSSDHASFIQAGIPALMFHRWQDPLLHTPQDVSDRVRPELLEQAARMGLAMLEALSAQG